MVKFTQERVEAQEKGQRIPKFHFEKFMIIKKVLKSG